MSRITLVTPGDDLVLEQITKQLNKIVHVVKVTDFKDVATVERELALIKVSADERSRGEVMNIVDIFRAKIVDVGSKSYIIEVTGNEEKIEALIDLLRPIGILEVARTGRGGDRSREPKDGGAGRPPVEREGGMNIYYDKDADPRSCKARRSR